MIKPIDRHDQSRANSRLFVSTNGIELNLPYLASRGFHLLSLFLKSIHQRRVPESAFFQFFRPRCRIRTQGCICCICLFDESLTTVCFQGRVQNRLMRLPRLCGKYLKNMVSVLRNSCGRHSSISVEGIHRVNGEVYR
jgi:hypothetical protein